PHAESIRALKVSGGSQPRSKCESAEITLLSTASDLRGMSMRSLTGPFHVPGVASGPGGPQACAELGIRLPQTGVPSWGMGTNCDPFSWTKKSHSFAGGEPKLLSE